MTLRDRASVGPGMAVVYIDLDDFKAVNDQYGHAAGDAVLVAAARRVRTAIRERDEVGRLGGDEFLVLCPDVASHTEGLDVIARIQRALNGTLTVDNEHIEVRATLGLGVVRPEHHRRCPHRDRGRSDVSRETAWPKPRRKALNDAVA